METLFVATGNDHKLYEINKILKDNGLEVNITCPKYFADEDEPLEDGKSFEENALIKARYWFNKYHLPTIADDSGICIKYLNDFPGIYSARFMSKYSYPEKNGTILKIMEGVENRYAAFHCALAYIDEFGNEKVFMGIFEGEIADSIKGEHGFGYDPIFYVPEYNKTSSEMSDEEKNAVSHRGKAFKEWANYVKGE